jgi:hypothetical protein
MSGIPRITINLDETRPPYRDKPETHATKAALPEPTTLKVSMSAIASYALIECSNKGTPEWQELWQGKRKSLFCRHRDYVRLHHEVSFAPRSTLFIAFLNGKACAL